MDERKKIKLWFIVIDACIVIYAVLWYLQCCYIFDNRGRTDQVREQLNSAATVQQEVTSGITDAENTAKDLTGRIESSQGAVNQASNGAGRVEAEVQSSGELIEDCQRVLGEVRRRGAKD